MAKRPDHGPLVVSSGGISIASTAKHSRARAKLDAICARIRRRTPINQACALEGVSRSMLYRLIDDDEDAATAIESARSEAALQDEAELRALIASESKTANVMLHLMERLYPADYGPPKQRVEQTGADGGPIQTESLVRWYVPANPRIPTGEEDE